MKRQVFNTLDELMQFIRDHPELCGRKSPYKIVLEGKECYTLGSNSDQAIAAVIRSDWDVTVSVIPATQLI